MNAYNAITTHADLYSRFRVAARQEIEAEILSNVTVSRSDDMLVFEVPGWGRKEVNWGDVQAIVHQFSFDELCDDAVGALIDGVEIIQ